MRASRRLARLPEYLLAEHEWRAGEMRARGIDVVNLSMGDPDFATFAPVVDAGRSAIADTSTHRYPTVRGRHEFRTAVADFYRRRFGVEINPDTEVIPALGAKECIFHLNLAFLDAGDIALAPDPGYVVYTTGPLLAGAEVELLPLLADRGFVPDLDCLPASVLERARLLYLNYPNTPTGAVVPDGFFDDVVAFARNWDLLVVHDNVYSEMTFDGYVAPSFLAAEGAVEVGVEVFSLSKAYNMTGWRCAAIVGNAEALESYRRLKANVDSGMFPAVQLAGAAALAPELDPLVANMKLVYARRRDLVCDALTSIGIAVTPPKGTVYVWASVPEDFPTSQSFCEHVLDQCAVSLSPGSCHGPGGEGHFRISLTAPDERLLEAVDRLGRLAAR